MGIRLRPECESGHDSRTTLTFICPGPNRPDKVVETSPPQSGFVLASFVEFYLSLGVEGITVYTLPQGGKMQRVIDYYR